MKKLTFLFFFLILSKLIFSQAVVVNEVFNGFAQKTDWVEILVIQNNFDLRNYQLRDFSGTGNPQQPIIFTNNPYWNGIHAGTLILITGDTSAFVEDTGKADFSIRLKFKSSDTTYLRGNQFNIATASDALQLRTPLNDTLHIHGISWGSGNINSLPSPKAYNSNSLNGGFLALPVAGASYYFTKSTIMTLSDFGVDANIQKDTIGGTPGRPNDSLSNGGNYQYIVSLRNLIGVKPTGEIANDFYLSQNYPNPFNPETNIEFSIPKSSFVTLSVYDILGKEVEKLVNSNLSAGQYTIKLDASNYPSGIYFYKIEASGYSKTNKMILIK